MKFVGCAFLGGAAAFLAHGLGIPWWYGWWPPGDAADIGVLVYVGVYLLVAGQPQGGGAALKSMVDSELRDPGLSRTTPQGSPVPGAPESASLRSPDPGACSAHGHEGRGVADGLDLNAMCGDLPDDSWEAVRGRAATRTIQAGGEPCYGCGEPGVVVDINGLDLCQTCADACRIPGGES